MNNIYLKLASLFMGLTVGLLVLDGIHTNDIWAVITQLVAVILVYLGRNHE
jgi:hypothetical protein